MDETIQRIIDFEKKAQRIVNEARKEKQTYEDSLRAEIDAFRIKTSEELKARTEGYIAQIKRDADEGVKHIEDAAKLKAVQMQKIASEQRGEWIDHLYTKILDGEIQ